MAMTEEQLAHLVINWVRSHLRSGHSRNGHGEVSADTDLIATGLVDSLGLIDLIAFIEEQSGRTIDLRDVDPSEFCVVKGLCRIATRNGQQ
ncbi:MAG: hypothetical protein DMD33_16950 [Gemmatimonadetes bacterium]|nr:MAG: hypothetical protein DMD33_16950 [Gemmatimonadota bacterium]PYO74007.1 MAG: hypothetical protein DMD67_14420 [Gemmatimonadota bacterium]TLY49556.1 MAG: acyl carrier protein [Gemmatimonadota bacterium]